MSLDLEQFLQRERIQGTYASEGQFTLSIEQARRKLSQFSLPSGEAWITKLLQAVVAWRVKKLEVTQSRAYSVFHFQPSLRYGLPTGMDIWNTFSSADIGGREPLQRFCLALHALREREQLSFLLAINDGRSEAKLFADGVHLKIESAKQRALSKVIREPGLTLAVSHLQDVHKRLLFFFNDAGGGDIKLRAAIAKRLWTDTQACPMPVVLDSRRLDALEQGVLAVDDLPLSKQGNSPLLLPTSLFEILQDKNRHGALWRNDASHSGYILYRFGKLARSSELHFVDDGAVVETLPLATRSRLHFTAFLTSDGLPTDLTGLKLVDCSQKKTRLQEARLGLRESVRGFKSNQDRHFKALSKKFGLSRDQWGQEVDALQIY